jgi:hypothetical protein
MMIEASAVMVDGSPVVLISKVNQSKRVNACRCRKSQCKKNRVNRSSHLRSIRNIVAMACIEHDITPDMIEQAARITTAHNIAGVRAALTKGQRILV